MRSRTSTLVEECQKVKNSPDYAKVRKIGLVNTGSNALKIDFEKLGRCAEKSGAWIAARKGTWLRDAEAPE